MAEAVVGSLLLKIGSALAVQLVKSTCSIVTIQAVAMKNFFNEMEDIQAELEDIRGYLHEAERFSETDANIKNFIREIRKVAFDIEDVVDDFTIKLEQQNRGVVSKTIKRIVHVMSWYQLTNMLKRIKTRIKDIQERKNRYDTSDIVKRGETQKGGRWRTAEDEHFVRESDLVGIDRNKEKLMKMLSDDNKKHNLITVLGMGGVEKTALVTHVYNTVKKNFEAFAWIAVSQTWDKDQLFRMLLRELHREDRIGITIDGIESMDFRSLVDKIHKYMHHKRYLVTLDDVWAAEVWHCIKDKLPQGESAWIILTTRSQEVALLAPAQQLMEVIPLEPFHSWNLFCNTAFKKIDTKTCPEELAPWAKKIVQKCHGLPLALLAIGGLMACKEQTEREWKRMWEDLEHELAHNPNIEYVNRILQLSFVDLSCNLKSCLNYWSIYPEDYVVQTDDLISRWIAEEFVETRENRAPEEVGESYLNELISRCLLQVVKRDEQGKVSICKMHDIIHSMVVSKSKEEEFCMVLNNPISLPGGKVRRVSIQNCNLECASNNSSSLRSLSTFHSKISIPTLYIMLQNSRFLRVLDLSGTSLSIVPKEVFTLYNLHYLSLNDTEIRELPKSIGRLQNLMYLWAAGTKIIELPNELTKLRRLREIDVRPEDVISNDGIEYEGVMPPTRIWQLKDLRVLNGIKATDEMVEKLGALKEITELTIFEIRSERCDDVFTAISSMCHLQKLRVSAKDEEVLKLQTLSTSAHSIRIYGHVERTSVPQFSMSLQLHNSIRMLVLNKARLDEDSFSCLQEIRSLRTLLLNWSYCGSEMRFHESSFLSLRLVQFMGAPHLQRIDINEGAMPNLETLVILNCPRLKEFPRGIEYLTKLEIIGWTNPDRTLMERVQRERAEKQLSDDRKRILDVVYFYSAENPFNGPHERIG